MKDSLCRVEREAGAGVKGEHARMLVALVIPIILPAERSESAADGPCFFDLRKHQRRPLPVTPRVEVTLSPSVGRPSVQQLQLRCCRLEVVDACYQEILFFFCFHEQRVFKEFEARRFQF